MIRCLCCLSLSLVLGAGEDDLAARILAGVTVVPSRIQMNHSVSFNQQGQVNDSESELGVYLQMRFTKDLPIIGYKDLKITKAVTDAGVALTMQDNRHYSQEFSHRGSSSFGLNLQFATPPQDTRRIAELTGAVTLLAVGGTRKKVTLSPISQWAADTAVIEGIEGATVKLQPRGDDDQMNLVFSSAMHGLIDEVRFYDRNGKQQDANQWGSGSGGATFSQTYGVKADDQGKVVIYFYERLQEIPYPFALTNLPCRPEDRKATGTKVLKPENANVPEETAKDDVEEVKAKGKSDVDF